MDIYGLTEESGINSADQIPFYDDSIGGNRKITFSDLNSALNHTYLPWQEITDFTSTPASTSTITTTSDLTTVINEGVPIKYTISGTTYIGQVESITSSLITIRGPALSGDITSLYIGDPARVIVLYIFIPGFFANATCFSLYAADLGQSVPIEHPNIYLVYIKAKNRKADSSSDTTFNLVKSTGEIGIAQAADTTSLTLASTASSTDDEYNNLFLTIVSGTGIGQIREITDYNGTTKVATVATWTTTPDTTSEYEILYGDPSGSGGILTSPQTLAYPNVYVKSGVLINPAMYKLELDQEIEIYTGAGTGKNAQDFSGVVVMVMA